MSASWPAAKKTFSQVVNGVTKLVALLFNANYDETEALQTFIGASGETQAKNAALMNIFRHQFDPVPEITYIDADTVEIEAKTVVMFNSNDYVIKRNTSAIQITLSGDLDTGSEAGSTDYYVYLCGDGASTTYTAVFSASDSAPSGYTYYKLIGKVYNDSGSDIDEDSVENINMQVPPQSVIKGWINFDGTGTIAINDSFNVSSITDEGTGSYTITWDTDFANAYYSTAGMAGYADGTEVDVVFSSRTKAVGSCRITCADTNGANRDRSDTNLIAIGDQ